MSDRYGVPVTTPYKRAWLRRQVISAAAASPAPITLRAQLELKLAEFVDAMAGGMAVASTSGNGHSVTFAESSDLAAGPEAMAELAGEMIDRSIRSAAALGIATPAATDNDAISNQMLAGLHAVRDVRSGYYGLRYA